ncbi:hypothetical protein Goshw_026998 [Gossypium schwendimanii]|uniref:RNase H type-1 domain-containing protein n=1 Tax=Gossypium schwendimanii TaxID=34291 RepID=A0A7J9MK87_GOSSC|nr:hypothetical protein [Gossypium schwendimanii]
MVGYTFWVLLTERNKYVHDGIKNQAQVIVERIKAQLEELDALNKLLLVAQVEIKSKGVVLGSTIIFNNHIPTGFVAEAITYLQAVRLGIDLEFQDVLMEGNSLTGRDLETVYSDIFKGRGTKRQWRKIDGEQLGEYLWCCEMKIEFKVLLGCSPIVNGSKSKEEKINSGDFQAIVERF